MPGGFAALDTGFPELEGSTEEKLRRMQDYLVQLLEQLRYTLHNLGAENFSQAGVERFTVGTLKADAVSGDRIDADEVRMDGELTMRAAAAGSRQTQVCGTIGGFRIASTGENGILIMTEDASRWLEVTNKHIEMHCGERVDGVPQYTELTLDPDGIHARRRLDGRLETVDLFSR